MNARSLKTLVASALVFANCVQVSVNGERHESYRRDPTSDYELAVLQAVWRHANRTQADPYPLSLEEAEKVVSPYGFGNLTPYGRREAFKMGRFLKERYVDFLPPYFTYSSTNMECLQISRTQETTLVGMSAIWPPTGPQVWQDQGLGSLWTPVPCKYLPDIEDKVFSQGLFCPRLVELLIENLNMPLFRAELAKDTKFGLLNEYIALHANVPSVSDLQLMGFYDYFDSLANNGHTLPHWAYKVYPEPLQTIYGLYFSSFASTPETAKLMTGEFWKKTMDIANSLESNEPSDKIFYGYSVHDVNVASLITSLRTENVVRPVPPFTSILLIEWYRHKNDPTQIAAKFVYRNDTLGNTVPLIIPGCDELCPLPKVKEAVMHLIPDQPRYKYCMPSVLVGTEDFEQFREITKLWSPTGSEKQYQTLVDDFLQKQQNDSR